MEFSPSTLSSRNLLTPSHTFTSPPHRSCRRRPTCEEIDRELVRIEMEFRLHRHRAASKRASSAHSAGAAAGSGSQGGGSLPASRPGSPDVAPRTGGAAPDPPTAS